MLGSGTHVRAARAERNWHPRRLDTDHVRTKGTCRGAIATTGGFIQNAFSMPIAAFACDAVALLTPGPFSRFRFETSSDPHL